MLNVVEQVMEQCTVFIGALTENFCHLNNSSQKSLSHAGERYLLNGADLCQCVVSVCVCVCVCVCVSVCVYVPSVCVS